MKAVNHSMLSLTKINLIVFFAFSLIFCSAVGFAEGDSEEKGVTHHGVVFNIAKDRKVEKIGGLYEPEGIDKYVERKMAEVNVRIAGLEEKLSESNKKLDEILKKLAQEAPAIKENEVKV